MTDKPYDLPVIRAGPNGRLECSTIPVNPMSVDWHAFDGCIIVDREPIKVRTHLLLTAEEIREVLAGASDKNHP